MDDEEYAYAVSFWTVNMHIVMTLHVLVHKVYTIDQISEKRCRDNGKG